VLFHRRPQATDTFSDSFAQFRKLLRSEDEQSNSKDYQQMHGLKNSFKHRKPPRAGSGILGARIAPYNAERMENNGVSECQLVGIQDNLTGIVDNWIQRQTPALVVDDPLAVLTSRLRVVLVAVIRDWLVVGHEFFSSPIRVRKSHSSCRIKFFRHPGALELGSIHQLQQPYQIHPH